MKALITVVIAAFVGAAAVYAQLDSGTKTLTVPFGTDDDPFGDATNDDPFGADDDPFGDVTNDDPFGADDDPFGDATNDDPFGTDDDTFGDATDDDPLATTATDAVNASGYVFGDSTVKLLER